MSTKLTSLTLLHAWRWFICSYSPTQKAVRVKSKWNPPPKKTNKQNKQTKSKETSFVGFTLFLCCFSWFQFTFIDLYTMSVYILSVPKMLLQVQVDMFLIQAQATLIKKEINAIFAKVLTLSAFCLCAFPKKEKKSLGTRNMYRVCSVCLVYWFLQDGEDSWLGSVRLWGFLLVQGSGFLLLLQQERLEGIWDVVAVQAARLVALPIPVPTASQTTTVYRWSLLIGKSNTK